MVNMFKALPTKGTENWLILKTDLQKAVNAS